jgi:hypothetical protein
LPGPITHGTPVAFMPYKPRVRARWSQRFLEQLQANAPEERGRIEAAYGEIVARILSSSPLGWVELADHMTVLDAAYASLGSARFEEVYRGSVAGAARSSLLRSLVDNSFRLFGRGSLARVFPSGWKLIYENAGEAHASRDEAANVTRLEIHGLAELQRRSPAWALSMKLALETVARSVKEPVEVEVDASRQREGVLVLVVRVAR